MKKAFLLSICLVSFICLKAQIFTSGHLTVTISDTMWHDSTLCSVYSTTNYIITIDSSYIGDTVNVVDTVSGTLVGSSPYVNTSGVTPWTFTVPLGTYGVDDYYAVGTHPGFAYLRYYLFAGYKVTSRHDTVYAMPNDSIFVPNPCIYDTVQGRIYIDNNSNCIFDAGDVGFYAYSVPPSYATLTENLSSPTGSLSNIYPTLVGTDGWYLYMVQKSWMVNYTITLPSFLAFIFPLSPCFAGPYAFTTLPQSNVDFPLQCSSSVDVQCGVLSPGSVRLHRPFYMQPYVSNTGCDTASGQLTLIKDSRVIYDPSLSLYPADTVRGDTLIWNYSGLSNLSSGAYWNSFLSDIYLIPDTTLTIGDTLCFRVYTNIPAADINPWNNDYTTCMPVVYSYDPNEKEVSPKGTGPEGYIHAGTDTLIYTLHFQNTGSAAAENINVVDTLDSHINANSLRILGTSHNMAPQWLAPGVVQFSYNEINLPDSFSNEPASHGEVRFSVALNAGLAAGTQIRNTGYIYFDLNPPVVTNTVLNTISNTTNTGTVKTAPAVNIYPNPATDHIVVENFTNGEVSILNVSGEVVMHQNVTNDKTTIDVSKLPDGVYLIKAINSLNTTTIKFTKY